MKSSKLINILKKFDVPEFERLKTFIDSPYFVKQKSLSDFATIVLNTYPSFSDDKIIENIVYEQLFPGQKFQKKTINDLMTLMISSIYNFFAVENFLNDPEENKIRLMEALRSKGMGSDFLRIAEKFGNELESGKKDQQYYYNQIRFQNELDIYHIQNVQHLGLAQFLKNKSEALDTYYLSAKLKFACDIINKKNIYLSDTDIVLLNEVIEYVSANLSTYEKLPSVIVYYRIILTLTKPEDENNFRDLLDHLETVMTNFSNTELRQIFVFTQNYCIKKINIGQVNYVKELFNIYLRLLETGIIYENNYLDQWDYKNIATIGLRLKEYEWTESFIRTNKTMIQPTFREMAYCYNLANLYYEKREFRDAIKTLLKFNDELKQISDPSFEDTFYNLDSRTMFLKIYYELEEEESFAANIETFKSFLKRNRKISEGQRIIYINLLKYTKKLSDMRRKLMNKTGKTVKKMIQELKTEINAEKNIVNLSWLQGRVEDLERKV